MKKLVLVSLAVAAVVAFTAGDAMAYRYYGGTYTVPTWGGIYNGGSGESPWYGDIGPGPFPYLAGAAGGALSDATQNGKGDASISETQQLMSANPGQVTFGVDDGEPWGPGSWNRVCRQPGDTNMWWGSANTDAFTAAVIDLGQEVEINAVANIQNAIWNDNYGEKRIQMKDFQVYGSHNGTDWTQMIREAPTTDGYAWYDDGYMQIMVRPSTIPIGLFWDGSAYTLDTVTYRYLKVNISRQSASPSDSAGISEFIIDAVPEPATMSLLLFGGLALLRRRK
jgi:hypothetical protein